jgi:hypothetical protein
MWTIFALICLFVVVGAHFFRGARLLFLGYLTTPLFLGLAVIFLGVQVFFWLRPAPVPLKPEEREAVRTAVGQALDAAKNVEGLMPATVAVVHLSGDPSDDATAVLREELERRDGWTPIKGTPAAAFVRDVAKTIMEATSVEECLRAGRRVGIDVIVRGKLDAVTSTNGTASAALFLSLYDTRKGADVISGAFQGSWPPPAPVARLGASSVSGKWIFGVFALLLPWLAAAVVIRAREARSNIASALLLAGLLALDMLVGAFFVKGLFSGVGIAISVGAVCLIYNLVVCEILSRRACPR